MPGRECHQLDFRDWRMLRGDRSSDAFRAKTWIYSFVATNCEELQFLWQPAETHIAQLELSMVIYTLSESPGLLRHRHGLWFLDAVAAVMTLVRGRSSNSDLAKLGHLIPLALFALRALFATACPVLSRARATGPTTWWRCHGSSFHSSYLPTIFSSYHSLQSFSPLNSSGALCIWVHWVIPAKAGPNLGWPATRGDSVWGYVRVTLWYIQSKPEESRWNRLNFGRWLKKSCAQKTWWVLHMSLWDVFMHWVWQAWVCMCYL